MTPPRTPPDRFLIVSADPVTRELVARRLGRDGAAVDVAANAVDGHRRFCERPYRAVLLDLLPSLPGGVAVLGARPSPHNPRTPVVVLLGVDEDDRFWAGALGAARLIDKLHTTVGEIVAAVEAAAGGK